MSRHDSTAVSDARTSDAERLIVSPARDGTWSWHYWHDGLELTSSSTYPTAMEAERAAKAAYPRLDVDVTSGSSRLGSSGEGRSRVLRGLSLVALIRRFAREGSSLLGEERELAIVEVRQAAKKAGLTGALFAAAAFVGLLAAIALTACIVIALSLVIAAWLAALIVGLAYGVVATALALGAVRSARRARPVMPKTTETMKETIGWAKHQMRSDERSS